MSHAENVLPEIWRLVGDQLILPDGRALMRAGRAMFGAIANNVARQAQRFKAEHCRTSKMRAMTPNQYLLLEYLWFGGESVDVKPESIEKLLMAYTGTITGMDRENFYSISRCFKYAAMGRQLDHLRKLTDSWCLPMADFLAKMIAGACRTDDAKYIHSVQMDMRDDIVDSGVENLWHVIVPCAVRKGLFNILNYCYDCRNENIMGLKTQYLYFFISNNMDVLHWAAKRDLLPPPTKVIRIPSSISIEAAQFLIDRGYELDTREAIDCIDTAAKENHKKFYILFEAGGGQFAPTLSGRIERYIELDRDGNLIRAVFAQMRRECTAMCEKMNRPDLAQIVANEIFRI